LLKRQLHISLFAWYFLWTNFRSYFEKANFKGTYMYLVTKLTIATAGATLLTLTILGTAQAQTVTLESGTFAPSQVDPSAGYFIGREQFLGWKFQLDSTLQITDIGGYLVSENSNPTSNDQIFGAIVSLSSPTALPQGNPFLPEEILASTTFIPHSYLSPSDITVPLSVTLNPGSYGLIFGSGLFGASGSASALFNFGDLPGTLYFSRFQQNGFSAWNEGFVSNVRFFVKGQLAFSPQAPRHTCTQVGVGWIGGLL
jgi:hypothetical protein